MSPRFGSWRPRREDKVPFPGTIEALMTRAFASLKALLFDVFGTVVDWRGSITRELLGLARGKGWDLDAEAFAVAWRAGYQPAMAKVRSGALEWTNLDGLHRMILDELLRSFDLRGLDEAEIDHLNRAWHRLDAWPDVRAGLQALRARLGRFTAAGRPA